MTVEKVHSRAPLHKRLIVRIVLPVFIVGSIISGLLIAYFSPPMETFLTDHFTANLRLASKLGVRICETYFNQLLDMRLEDNPEMNLAMKTEALEEIRVLGQQVPKVHVLVLENRQTIKMVSIDLLQQQWELPSSGGGRDRIQRTRLGGKPIIAHVRYFPFWGWHIVSFVEENDFLAPISAAKKMIYMSTIGVLVTVFITLLLVFRGSITAPIQRLILATGDVSRGKLLPVDSIQENEIGQLTQFFNTMVSSLKTKTEEVDALIGRLRESEKQYRSLVELSPEAVFVHQDGRINYINRCGSLLFGTSEPDELIGKPVIDMIHPDFRKTAAGSMKEVYDRKITLAPEELKYLTFAGEVIDVEATGTYIEYEGKPAMLSVVRDITERRRAEKFLRDNEEKLARSKKMESLGLLAGGVAHDLNNVLSGIVTYPELLLMDLPPDSRLRKPIETMQESGHRAVAIVQDLLTVARGVATNKEPLNLNKLITDYLGSPEFRNLETFHSEVVVATDLYDDLFNISGSQVHVRKVIMNLVSNAAEAINGGGKVVVSTQNRYVDRPLTGYHDIRVGEYAVLAVRDDGPGISADDLERIFEPFYTKKVMGRSGTGLGLAVVWNVVQEHKGYINVLTGTSGTVFELFFPITREYQQAPVMPMPVEEYMGNGQTILVIDDVQSQREITCTLLNKLNYNSLSVSSGEDAIDYLVSNQVDLIVLDMIMDPGMSGRETFEKIHTFRPDQKAIIVSGYAETDDVRHVQRLGAGRFLRKPMPFEALGIAVKEVLES